MDHTDNLRERIEALEEDVHRAELRLRWWRGIACAVMVLALLNWALPSSMAKDAKPRRATALEERVQALEGKLQHVTSTPDELIITAANLRIVNGLGDTETTNGLGNLIVGYNESRSELLECRLPFGSPDSPGCIDRRTGSHTIVVGQFHNFSSYGGFIAGVTNEITDQFASISGGENNTASGPVASISGGIFNTASGVWSSVSGGQSNEAFGNFSSVSGGETNTASDAASSVSGGNGNTASAFWASVGGGFRNTASGRFSSVSGGINRTAPEEGNWAAGPLFADN